MERRLHEAVGGGMRSPVPHHCRLPFDPLALILEYAADKVIMCGAREV